MKRLLVILATLLCTALHAQPFPNRSIKIVVPFPPGGNLDFIARTIQPKLSESLDQPVILEYKGGAGGIIGADYAAKQPADGYTILMGNTGIFGIYAAVYPQLPYDPVRDFAGVGMTSTAASLAVLHPDVPAKTLQELVAFAKENPNRISAGVAGSGSLSHFAAEMLKVQAGIQMQVVPYKGSGPAVADLLGGHVQLLIDAPPVTMPYIKAGKLQAIAVTGSKRLDALPEVPTFDEAGVTGVDANGWQGIAVPAGTPGEVIGVLSRALAKIIGQPEIRDKFATQGLDTSSMSAEEFSAHIRSQVPKWAHLAKSANIKAE